MKDPIWWYSAAQLRILNEILYFWGKFFYLPTQGAWRYLPEIQNNQLGTAEGYMSTYHFSITCRGRRIPYIAINAPVMQPIHITFPDTMRDWPFPRELNPYYAEVKKESDAWLKTFNFFNHKDTEAYLRCDFGTLASGTSLWRTVTNTHQNQALATALIYPRLNKGACFQNGTYAYSCLTLPQTNFA
jgi:hypothetical protein